MRTADPSLTRSIPSLDGLRAVSIALVVVAHIVARLGWSEWPDRVLNSGTLGVHVFFVISGFLITTLLLRELDRHGRIGLGRFYIRRILRIFPAYYAYLFVIACLLGAGLIEAHVRWVPALSYTTNISFSHQSWLVGHAWSLSVEEQFYVVWPACIALLGRRSALKVALAVLLLSPVLRLALFALTRSAGWSNVPEFDSIAAGCVLAMLWPTLQRDGRFLAVLRARAFVLIPVSTWLVSMVFSNQVRWFFIADLAFARTYVAVGLALSVAWCILNATSTVGRVLNAAPVRTVGVLSYSLYLWQELFTWRRFPIPLWFVPIAAVLAATASYVLVERPGLRLRELLEARWRSFMRGGVSDAVAVQNEAAL